MSENVGANTELLRNFMFQNVYSIQSKHEDAIRAREIVHGLYEHLARHEDCLPAEYRTDRNNTSRHVVDFIAGMTDQYATNLAVKLSI